MKNLRYKNPDGSWFEVNWFVFWEEWKVRTLYGRWKVILHILFGIHDWSQYPKDLEDCLICGIRR